ncbi:MAG: phosphatidate cytidylyltransferase [Clostridia bacterium]|nr:phosphatidate cytidylyltransferase [Clostridia bacterium]
MLKRCVSGALFVVVVAGFFLLRQFVDYRYFNILLAFFGFTATFEVARALKPFTGKATFILSTVYGGLFLVAYFIGEYFVKSKYGVLFALDIAIIFMTVFSVITYTDRGEVKDFLVKIVPIIYPSFFLVSTFMVNDFGTAKGFIALLLIFIISPFSDTFAYFVGVLWGKIRKGKQKKLCPKLSPNKTVAGAIGGVIGGAVGGLLVYFIFTPSYYLFTPVLFYAVIGLVASVFTILGDLLESLIKRRAGIKDMGNIMPGHGGIADRIDGIIVASVFIYLTFILT